MPDEPASVDFLYVQTDIPPGMTIAERRADRAAQTPRRPTRGVRLLVAAALALVGRGSGSQARAAAGDAASSSAMSTDRVPAITAPTTAADRRGLRWRGDAGAEQSPPGGLPIPTTRRPSS